MDLLCILNHIKKCVRRYFRVSRLIYSSSSRVSIKVKSGWINLLRSLSSWFLKISTGSHFHFSGQLTDFRSLLLWRIVFPQLWSEFFLLQCVIIGSWPSTVYIWEASVSISSMSSFSRVKDAITSPLNFLFSEQHRLGSLSLFSHVFLLLFRLSDPLLRYPWFVAHSHVGGPSLLHAAWCFE